MAALGHAEECLDHRLPTESLGLASHVTSESVRRVAADGKYLCWAAVDNGNQFTTLHWCLAGPDGSLVPLGSHPARRDGAALVGNHLQVNGNRVVLGDWSKGWQVVDFSDPAAPSVPWEAPSGTTIGGPMLVGNRLLVPTAAGLAVLDLVAGGPPVQRSLVDLVPPASRDATAWTMQLALDGARCWALVEYPTGDSLAQYLVVVDITDPDAPTVSTPLPLGYSNDCAAGTYNALAADSGTAIVTRRLRYWSGRPFDFSDTFETLFYSLGESGAPTLVQRESSSMNGGADISGDLAWVVEGYTIRYFEHRGGIWHMRQSVATGSDGLPTLAASAHAVWSGYDRDLRAWTLRIPESSPNLGVAYRPLAGHCIGLDVVGDRLVTLVWELGGGFSDIESWGFVELDAADPLRLAPTASAARHVWFVYSFIVGNHAYTNGGIFDFTTRAWVNTSSPPVFGGVGIALWAWESPGRLVTYDATDPAAPVRRTECFAIDGDMWDLPVTAAANGIAVFAHGDTLIAADVTAPLDPVVVDRLAVPFSGVRAMLMENGLLYVAHASGLSVVAVGPGGSLTLRGQTSGTGSGLSALALDDRLLYAITASGGRLQIFDVGDPALSLLIAEPGASGYDLLLRDDLLYVAGYSITAVRRQCPLSVPVSLHDLNLVWLAGASRLSWQLDGISAAVRVLARAGDREWIVPWHTDGQYSVAVDEKAPAGQTAEYAVQILADNQWLTIAEASLAIPGAALALAAPAPNPFNAATAFEFTLDAPGFVELSVLDAAGRVVRVLLAEPRAAGHHQVMWRGNDGNDRPVAAGTYLIRLAAAHGIRTVKAVLLK